MEPRTQYVRTSDGVSIAYWTLGEGPVLVSIALPASHIGYEWQVPTLRAVYEASAKLWRFVRYDPRGLGLSDRDVDDFSVDALVRDLDAVVDRLGAPTIRLVGLAMAGTVALAYAARHPKRVSHLAIVNGFDRGADALSPKLTALTSLAQTDWAFASETIMRAFAGWEDEEAARVGAAFFREAIRPQQLLALRGQLATWDVADELPNITAKALVVQHKMNPAIGPNVARRLGATIPTARVVLLDGYDPLLLGPNVGAHVGRFLADVPDTSAEPSVRPTVRHRTAVILFADVVGSTALTEEVGDVQFRERMRPLEASLRQIVAASGGEPVEGTLLGDGMLAVFTAASDAIHAALECAARGDAIGLQLHLGLHAGDVLRERGNVHGGPVNVAARISAEAGAGEVLVSDVVRSLARTSSGNVSFEDRGEHRLKGVAELQRLYRVCPAR
jgi:class 3 adenylate cyclase